MDLLGSAVPEFPDRVILELGSPDNGILTENDPVPLNDLLNGDELHGGDQITDLLGGGRIAPTIPRCVFDQGPPVGQAGFHGIADRMSDLPVRL